MDFRVAVGTINTILFIAGVSLLVVYRSDSVTYQGAFLLVVGVLVLVLIGLGFVNVGAKH
jgi:uncharacterized membrane protein SirB2